MDTTATICEVVIAIATRLDTQQKLFEVTADTVTTPLARLT